MRISAVASAFPEHYYSQQQIVDELTRHWFSKVADVETIRRLHSRVGVSGRHLTLPIDEYEKLTTWGQANDVWLETGRKLGAKAICEALQRSGLSKSDVGALIAVSVTGIASPSLDAHLVNDLELPRNVRRVPIFGLGCVAGAAGIAQAAEYVRAYPERVAVLLSVELCSLTWQRQDVSVANIISSGLFGDGAAAVVVAGSAVKSAREPEVRGPEVVASQSSFYPNTRHIMGWDISESGFQIVLSPDVPKVIQENLARDVDHFLAGHNLTRAEIGSWVLHTGGPKVLEATAAALALPEGACAASWECLDRVGNLSSTSVLLVLEDVMMHRRPEPGTMGLLMAMGPGFCSELVLLRW